MRRSLALCAAALLLPVLALAQADEHPAKRARGVKRADGPEAPPHKRGKTAAKKGLSLAPKEENAEPAKDAAAKAEGEAGKEEKPKYGTLKAFKPEGASHFKNAKKKPAKKQKDDEEEDAGE